MIRERNKTLNKNEYSNIKLYSTGILYFFWFLNNLDTDTTVLRKKGLSKLNAHKSNAAKIVTFFLDKNINYYDFISLLLYFSNLLFFKFDKL
jgi:hypothetical protein